VPAISVVPGTPYSGTEFVEARKSSLATFLWSSLALVEQLIPRATKRVRCRRRLCARKNGARLLSNRKLKNFPRQLCGVGSEMGGYSHFDKR